MTYEQNLLDSAIYNERNMGGEIECFVLARPAFETLMRDLENQAAFIISREQPGTIREYCGIPLVPARNTNSMTLVEAHASRWGTPLLITIRT